MSDTITIPPFLRDYLVAIVTEGVIKAAVSNPVPPEPSQIPPVISINPAPVVTEPPPEPTDPVVVEPTATPDVPAPEVPPTTTPTSPSINPLCSLSVQYDYLEKMGWWEIYAKNLSADEARQAVAEFKMQYPKPA